MTPRLWLHLSWFYLWVTHKRFMQIKLYSVPLGYCSVSCFFFCLFLILLSRFVNIIHKSLLYRPLECVCTDTWAEGYFIKRYCFCFFFFFPFHLLIWSIVGYVDGKGGVCLDKTEDCHILLCRLSLCVTQEAWPSKASDTLHAFTATIRSTIIFEQGVSGWTKHIYAGSFYLMMWCLFPRGFGRINFLDDWYLTYKKKKKKSCHPSPGLNFFAGQI